MPDAAAARAATFTVEIAMGFADSFDKITDMAKDKLKDDDSILEKGIDLAGDKFDEATDGKYASMTDKAQDFANKKADDYTGADQ